MIRNLGAAERTLRILIGVGLLALAAAGSGWAWIGFYPLATGLLANDPLFQLLELRSVRVRRGTARS